MQLNDQRGKKRKVNPHYKFTNKTVPLIAVVGLCLGAMSFLALVLTVLFTFQKGGETPLSYGLTWVVAFVFSAVGLFFSVKGRMRPDTYVFFPTIGMVVNSVNIFLVIYIMGRGILAM
jgi:hypothetical protein